jgi:hypothetical protein
MRSLLLATACLSVALGINAAAAGDQLLFPSIF